MIGLELKVIGNSRLKLSSSDYECELIDKTMGVIEQELKHSVGSSMSMNISESDWFKLELMELSGDGFSHLGRISSANFPVSFQKLPTIHLT